MKMYPPLSDSELRPPHLMGIFVIFSGILGTSVLLILRLKNFAVNEGQKHPAFQTLLSVSLMMGAGYLVNLPVVKLYQYESFSTDAEKEAFEIWNVALAFYNHLFRILAIVLGLTTSSPQYRKLFLRNLKNFMKKVVKFFPPRRNFIFPIVTHPMHDTVS